MASSTPCHSPGSTLRVACPSFGCQQRERCPRREAVHIDGAIGQGDDGGKVLELAFYRVRARVGAHACSAPIIGEDGEVLSEHGRQGWLWGAGA